MSNTTGTVELKKKSEKKILPAFLLCFFLGGLGIHRFYAGKVGTGIAMLCLTASLVGAIVSAVWVIIDLAMIVSGLFKDKKGNLLQDWV